MSNRNLSNQNLMKTNLNILTFRSQKNNMIDKTTNQTKEEKIGNLPAKEFRIMIVKMIQNLENKNGVTDKQPGDKD